MVRNSNHGDGERRYMTGGQTTTHDREATLRRVAIVLSSLPPQVASDLLGSMQSQQQLAVRRAMQTLADVDPLERHRAFHAFKTSVDQQRLSAESTRRSPYPRAAAALQPARSQSTASQVVDQRPDRSSDQRADQPPDQRPDPLGSNEDSAATPALTFLEDVDDQLLVSLLHGEHPQAVALVMASIAPAQAARVLPQLDARTQTETLARIGRLREIPETTLAEIAAHLKSRIEQQQRSSPADRGRRAVAAILANMTAAPVRAEGPVPTPPPAGSPLAGSSPAGSSPAGSSPAGSSLAHRDFPSAATSAAELSQRLRAAEQQWSTDESVERSGEFPAATLPQPAPLASTDGIAAHLEGLSAAELCRALGQVDTRTAVLALCGLPHQTAEAALAVLPRGDARKVRAAMNSLSSLNLREIDQAKEAVARATLAPLDREPLAA